MKFKIIFILALVPLKSAAATGVVNTPFQLNLEQKAFSEIFYQSVVAKALKGIVAFPLNDFTVSDPFTVKVSGISLNLNYGFEKPKRSNDLWEFQTDKLSADLIVQRIDATQIIHIVNDGNEMDIRLDGYCTDVRLHLPEGTSSASGNIQMTRTDLPKLELQKFQAYWKPGSWQIVSMNCQGPQGFDQVIAKAAGEKLQQINPFLPDIETQIQNTLNAGLRDPISIDFELDSKPRIQLHVDAPPFTGRNAQVQVNGTARFQFSLPDARDCDANISGTIQGNAGNSLSIPFEATKALLNCAQKAGILKTNFDSRKVPAFLELQKSKTAMSYVWPDLLKFSKEAIFQFSLLGNGNVNLGGEKRTAANEISAQLTYPLKLRVFAPKGEKYAPYLSFLSSIDGPVKIQMKSGTFRLFSKKLTQLETEWDRDYLNNYETNQKLAEDKIQPKLDEAAANEGISFPLPIFYSNGIKLTPLDGDLLGKNFQIRFSLSKGNISN